jgi:hypothetical protein
MALHEKKLAPRLFQKIKKADSAAILLALIKYDLL